MKDKKVEDQVLLQLRPSFFGEQERALATSGDFVVSTFQYSTGVAALRISNSVGEIEVLPFQGQQIWRANFHGRALTMRSMFPEPVPTTDYLATYGGFLIHCGATAMGNPGPDDQHGIHGELPNAHYRSAELIIGSDELGSYLSVRGAYQYTVAFSQNYIARPTLTLRAGSSRISVEMEIENLKASPMEFMYLAHINFLPVDDGLILDTAPSGGNHVRLVHIQPDLLQSSPAYREMLEELEGDLEQHRHVRPGHLIDPEVVLAVDGKADKSGWASSMQIHPDGCADFVRHRPSEFDHCLRWIARSGDQAALGLLLPATAEADGFIAERAKGNVRVLEPHATVRFAFECGALDALAAAEMAKEINEVRSGEMRA